MNWRICSRTNQKTGQKIMIFCSNFYVLKMLFVFYDQTSNRSQWLLSFWSGQFFTLVGFELSTIRLRSQWHTDLAMVISHRSSFHSNKTIFPYLWNKLACCGWFFPLELTIDALLPLDHKTISYFTLLSMFGKCTNLIPISFHKHNKVFCDWDAKCFIGEIREKKCI